MFNNGVKQRCGAILIGVCLWTHGGSAYGTESEESWHDIKGDIFGAVTFVDGSAVMELITPKRAHDASIVPFEFKPKNGATFASVAIVIDENPAPVAAVFHFSEHAPSAAFSTHFRVDSYGYVRAVATTRDGTVYMVRNHVKASGGCSAPAGKNVDAALAGIGEMNFRDLGSLEMSLKTHEANRQLATGQVVIKHPNFSGLQKDQITHLYIPAHFIDNISIKRNNTEMVRVEGGISLSTDPAIRFLFDPRDARSISVDYTDTQGGQYRRFWPYEPLTLGDG